MTYDDLAPPLSKDPGYRKFWSLKTFTASDGRVKVSPCYYQATSRGTLALYQTWGVVCLASDPDPAIERAKELAEATGDPFRSDPGTPVPYPS